MKISKSHKRFSELLNQLDVLTNPEKYLGPNWGDVLNFWIYLDTLSVLEKREMNDLYFALDDAGRDSGADAAYDAAVDVVGRKFGDSAWYAACDATRKWVFGWATLDLIGSYKILKQNKTPTFLPLCIKP